MEKNNLPQIEINAYEKANLADFQQEEKSFC